MKLIKRLKIARVLQVVQGITLLLTGAIAMFKIFPELQTGSKELGEIFEFLPTLMLAPILLAFEVMVWFDISLVMQKRWTMGVCLLRPWSVRCSNTIQPLHPLGLD
ncbi:MAG: hypothetical protein KAR40_10180 [Candidatus Sabulitectum sp.]|nr:hypothetical protein [Candidatus Sabulitectum sp.]